jgi:hypothetical protein
VGWLMKRKKRIEEEVDKTLSCLDENEEIEVSPFFFTRLQAAIRGQKEEKVSFFTRLFGLQGLRPALLGLMVVLNLVSTVLIWQRIHRRATDRSQYLSALVDEYSLKGSDTYLFTSDE